MITKRTCLAFTLLLPFLLQQLCLMSRSRLPLWEIFAKRGASLATLQNLTRLRNCILNSAVITLCLFSPAEMIPDRTSVCGLEYSPTPHPRVCVSPNKRHRICICELLAQEILTAAGPNSDPLLGNPPSASTTPNLTRRTCSKMKHEQPHHCTLAHGLSHGSTCRPGHEIFDVISIELVRSSSPFANITSYNGTKH